MDVAEDSQPHPAKHPPTGVGSRSNSREHVKIRLSPFARSELGGEQWLPYVYDEAAHHLQRSRSPPSPPSLTQHAQETGRYTAIAIGLLNRDAARAPEGIADGLGHLLTVSVFADAAASADPAPTHRDQGKATPGPLPGLQLRVARVAP